MELVKSFLISSFCLFGLIVTGQTQIGLEAVQISADRKINQDLIEEVAYSLLNSETDESKDSINKVLKKTLLNELNKEEALSFSFNAIKSISILSPKDSTFILFNWNIPYSDGSFNYECGILIKTKQRNPAFAFFEPKFLNKDELETQSLDSNFWNPCLFYKIIENETAIQKYYTLLFWDGNSRLTNKKGIDVIWFNRSNQVRFGAPIFHFANSQKKSRIVFEFGGQNRMKLEFNQKLNRIQFDHLSPPPPDNQNPTSLDGIFEYYGPDLSYDSFDWNGQKWIHYSDIDLDKGIKKTKRDFEYDKDIIREDIPVYKSNN